MTYEEWERVYKPIQAHPDNPWGGQLFEYGYAEVFAHIELQQQVDDGKVWTLYNLDTGWDYDIVPQISYRRDVIGWFITEVSRHDLPITENVLDSEHGEVLLDTQYYELNGGKTVCLATYFTKPSKWTVVEYVDGESEAESSQDFPSLELANTYIANKEQAWGEEP